MLPAALTSEDTEIAPWEHKSPKSVTLENCEELAIPHLLGKGHFWIYN